MSESKLASVLPNNSVKGIMPRNSISTVYVENSNNDSSLEDIMYTNDVTQGFTSTAWGSQNLFKFSRTYQFLAQIIMELELAPNVDIPLSDYIAYSAIDRIRWSISGTELLSISGNQLLYLALEQCETQEKKEALLNAAGRRYFTTNGTANLDIQTNVALPLTTRENKFYALIPCPWSSLSKMNAIKPFPLHMLSGNIELQIIFKRRAEFLGGASSTNAQAANLHFRYGKLGNPEMIKNQVYRYPFHSHFSHDYSIEAGGKSKTLEGFRKGEVEQLILAFVPDVGAGGVGTDSAGLQAGRHFDGVEVQNLNLLFNGQTIWSMPGNESRIWNLIDGIGPKRHNKRRWAIINSAVNVPVVGGEVASHVLVEGMQTTGDAANGVAAGSFNEDLNGRYIYYVIPIAEITAEYQKQGHYLGADFSRQTLQLTFDPIKARNSPNGKLADANIPIKLYATYTYRALYQFTGDSALLVY